jgi:hypothetical protein
MTVQEADTLIQFIKSKYPNPRCSIAGYESTDYCVGGALCMTYYNDAQSLGHDTRFPVSKLYELLKRLNNRLSTQTATLYGNVLISENDYGQFEDAWTVMRNALCYPINPNEVTDDCIGR